MQPTQDPGSDFNSAYDLGEITSLQSITEFVGSTDAIDVYKFSLTQTSNFDLSLTNLEGRVDLQVVIDSNQNGRIDDGETIYNKSFFGSPEYNSALGAGDYFVRVIQDEDTTNTNYNLNLSSLTTPASIATDPGNDFNSAYDLGEITSLQSITEFVGSTDTIDVYKFSLTKTSNFDISLTDLEGRVDLQVVIDSNQNGRIDDGETIYNKSFFGSPEYNSALGAGDYFVRVIQDEDTTNTNYNLNLSSLTTPASIATDPGNDFNSAYDLGEITSLQSITEFVGSTDTIDVYKFSLTKTSNFDISLTDLEGRVDLQVVIDSNQNGRIDDGETIYNKSFFGSPEYNSALGAGDYFIRVIQDEDTTNTNYNLNLSSLATPASIATDPGSDFNNAYQIKNINLNIANDNRSFTEFVGSTDTIDVYNFSLLQSTQLDLSLTDLEGRVDLQLIVDRNQNGRIDDDETIYNKSFFGSPEYNSNVEAGNYFVRVIQDSSETNTNYTLNLNYIADPINSIVTLETLDGEASETENDTGVVRISRQGDTSQAQTVTYIIETGNEEAINGVDYAELSGSIIVPENADYVDLVIAPTDDLETEITEQVNITLTGVSNDSLVGFEKTARVTIADNDVIEQPQMLLTDVHRFYQYERGFHLYTADSNEIEYVREQSSLGELSYNYESEQYRVLASENDTITGEEIEGVEPIYRFFNNETGAHLYTMDQNEKNYIQDNLDNYSFEGIQYYAFESDPQDIETIPVYRMLNTESGAHLFSSDANEISYIEENLPNFSMENNGNAAFHVFEL